MEIAFFVVAKAVWALLRPDTLLLLGAGLALALAALGRRRAGFGAGLATLAAALAVAVLPLGGMLLGPLEARFPPAPELRDPAGILVLGGGEEVGPHAALPQLNAGGERYIAAMGLARRFPDIPVMFAGGAASLSGGTGRQAAVSRALLERGGVAPGRIVLESGSRNTAENAANALPLRPEGTQAGPWVLITSAWHMPRALGTFCAAGWEGLVAWPTDFRARRWHVGWAFAENLAELNLAAKEWVGLAGYRLTGRTDALLPAGCPPRS